MVFKISTGALGLFLLCSCKTAHKSADLKSASERKTSEMACGVSARADIFKEICINDDIAIFKVSGTENYLFRVTGDREQITLTPYPLKDENWKTAKRSGVEVKVNIDPGVGYDTLVNVLTDKNTVPRDDGAYKNLLLVMGHPFLFSDNDKILGADAFVKKQVTLPKSYAETHVGSGPAVEHEILPSACYRLNESETSANFFKTICVADITDPKGSVVVIANNAGTPQSCVRFVKTKVIKNRSVTFNLKARAQTFGVDSIQFLPGPDWSQGTVLFGDQSHPYKYLKQRSDEFKQTMTSKKCSGE